MKYIIQHDIRDCGATCICMIAEFYGLKLSLSYCREITKTDQEGANLVGLVYAADKIGLKATALSGTFEELTEDIRKGKVKLPIIAHTVTNGMLHFIVIKRIKNGKIIAADPGRGKLVMQDSDFIDRWTGNIVTFQKTDAFKAGDKRKSRLIQSIKYLHGKWQKLIGIFLTSIIVSAIGIAGAFVFMLVMNSSVVNGGNTAENLFIIFSSGASIRLDYLFLALCGLFILQAVISFFRAWLITKLSVILDTEITMEYFNHIFDLPASSVVLRQTGEYLSRFSDIGSIRDVISEGTVTLFLDTFMTIACGFILSSLNIHLFLIATVMIAVYGIIVILYRNPIEKNNRVMMEEEAAVESWIKEGIDGITTIKVINAEKKAKEITKNKFHIFINSIFKYSMIVCFQDTVVSAVELIGTVVILWAGFSMVYRGVLTIGALLTFYALLAYFINPFKNLIGLQPMLQKSLVAVDRLHDILDLSKESHDTGLKMLSSHSWQMNNVDFRYGNRELILKNVSIKIKQGEHIALVGESGSGKTTLAKLLLGFYTPENGEIYFDGKNINTINLDSVRDTVTYVEQEPYFFTGTIKENLKWGNEGVSDEEIAEMCRLTRAHDFISEMPLQYNSPMLENGINISGGQRQRLAIARALLKKPKLLILDEATSNLDSITEMAIKETIQSIKGMSFLIIAHRLGTIKNCDRIYVMDKGEIVENGTHDELIRKNGRYASFWNNQS